MRRSDGAFWTGGMTIPAAPVRFCPECGQPRAEEVCPQHGIPTIIAQTDDFTKQLIGTVIAGRYKVESLIGQGGFGAVFRARFAAFNR